MSKINVLEFSNQWSMGGTEKSIQLFLKHIDKEKFNTFAAGWRGGPREPLIRPLVSDMLVTENFLAMAAWIRSKHIDIVHFHRMGDSDHNLIDVLVAGGVKNLVEHNIFAHFDDTSDRLRINRHIFVSKAQLEIYKGRSGVYFESPKCSFIYNPVETASFDSYNWTREWSAPVFGRFSRSDVSKWHPINVQILPIVKSAIPNAKFHVIGLPDEYRDAIKAIGCLDMVVEFKTTVNEVELCDFLNGITVMTHGSIYGESFGVSIAESMAAGLPIVTHSGGDSAQAELVTNDFNGYVTDPSDINGYADKVIHLLRNPSLKQSMGGLGQQRTREWFNAPMVTKQLENIFVDIAK